MRRAGGGRRRFQRPSRVPAAANLKPKDDQAARPAAVQLGRGFCLRLRLAAVHTARPGWFSLPGCGLPSQVTGLTRVMSTASWVGTIPEREAVAYDLDAPAVVDRHIEVHSRQSNVTTNAGSGFMADARDCLLDRNGSAGEDARRGTSDPTCRWASNSSRPMSVRASQKQARREEKHLPRAMRGLRQGPARARFSRGAVAGPWSTLPTRRLE